MNRFELIIIAVLVVISAVTIFDWTVYVIKNAPKAAQLPKYMWSIGLLSLIALVYWYMNGMKFI